MHALKAAKYVVNNGRQTPSEFWYRSNYVMRDGGAAIRYVHACTTGAVYTNGYIAQAYANPPLRHPFVPVRYNTEILFVPRIIKRVALGVMVIIDITPKSKKCSHFRSFVFFSYLNIRRQVFSIF